MADNITCKPNLHLLADLKGHSDRAWYLAWNPRMPILASCSSDKDVRLHSYSFVPTTSETSCSSRKPMFQLRELIPTGHRRTVRQLAWCPTGRTLATASFDSTVGIWERAKDVENAVNALNGNPGHDPYDGRPIKLNNGGAELDDPEWDCIGTLEGHESECKSVAFSHTGAVLASCSRDKSVWIWEVQPDAEFECLSVLMEHSQDVKTVTWHPHEEVLASASYDDAIKLYVDDPTDDWYCFCSLTGHTSTVWSLSFSPCGNYLASASDDQTARIWQRLTPEECQARNIPIETRMPGRKAEKWVCAAVLQGYHNRTIYSVSWGSDNSSKREGNLGRIATAGGDGRICVFTISKGQLAPTVELVAKIDQAHGVSDINCVAWAPTHLYSKSTRPPPAAAVDDSEIPSDAATEEDLKTIHHVCMSDMLASAGDDGTIKVWTVPTSPFSTMSSQ